LKSADHANIATREGITRARVTQVMGMLNLAPEIQKHILSLPDMVRRPATTGSSFYPLRQSSLPSPDLLILAVSCPPWIEKTDWPQRPFPRFHRKTQAGRSL
jgi:hypothetical protein